MIYGRLRWRSVVVGSAVVLGVLVSAGLARAAFPGRNGLLAVVPKGGRGIVLVHADGSGERRVEGSSEALQPEVPPSGSSV